MERISYVLNGFLLPFLIITCGIILSYKINLFRILKPKNFIRYISEASRDKKSSPFKSMCTALAGTLGVGNIAGVSTAITAGGAGAIFWMWVGALLCMSVKYGEVALAVKYRNYSKTRGFYGGSMYTMKKALRTHLGSRKAYLVGGVFSILCIANSFVMGNVIQSNAASSAFSSKSQLIGIILTCGLLLTAKLGYQKISNLTLFLIPPLSSVYIILSLTIIIGNYQLLPTIISKIIRTAFSSRAVSGGIYGLGIKEAVRFGMTRGIFSNEAGCGTAPSAHASADVKSPHHQGCYGIFEVIADTLILCSMTAFVILISDNLLGDSQILGGVDLALRAFKFLLGKWAYYIIGISIILFAFATLIAQLYYGDIAISYFTEAKTPRVLFVILSAILCFIGAVIKPNNVWILADIIVGIMTVINTVVLIVLRNQIADISETNK